MPVHHAVVFRYTDFGQGATTGSGDTDAGVGLVGGTVGRADQPFTGAVEKSVGLEIHLHRNVHALVDVSVGLPAEPDGKRTAGLPAKNHVKWHGLGAVFQIGRIAKGDDPCTGRV